MNERIKLLAEQAWTMVSDEERNKGELYDADKQRERRDQVFAELIVRECVGVVEGGHFLHDQAPTALFAKECSGAIKEHFGVEE